MTFDSDNKYHNAQLYMATAVAAKFANAYIQDFLEKPFEKPGLANLNGRANLRKGSHSPIHAAVLYDYIRDHYFAAEHRPAPDVCHAVTEEY